MGFGMHTFTRLARDACLQSRVTRSSMYEFYLELVCMGERALCYLQTGNPKVLCKAVMSPLLLLASLKTNGVPTIKRDFLPISGDFFSGKDAGSWPVDEQGNPQSCSAASQTYWYSLAHYQVSRYFTVDVLFEGFAGIHCDCEQRVALDRSLAFIVTASSGTYPSFPIAWHD